MMWCAFPVVVVLATGISLSTLVTQVKSEKVTLVLISALLWIIAGYLLLEAAG